MEAQAQNRPRASTSCAQMASFWNREYTEFEKANFVTVFRCRQCCTEELTHHLTKQCEMCEELRVPPNNKGWTRTSTDDN